MTARLLLDTNIVIGLFAGDTSVLQRIGDAEEIFVPAIVLGELHYGAKRSVRAEQNIAKIDDFARESVVLGCDVNTAKAYGTIKNGLRAKGRPIPENDIWIAAVALQYGLEVATRDPHFMEIDRLDVVAF